MATAGGAMAGYCAIGSVKTEIAPASITMMARTHAKMGRSIKKRAMVIFRLSVSSCRFRDHHGSRLGGRGGRLHIRRPWHGLDDNAWCCTLLSVYDQPITCLQTPAHQPLIADGTIRHQRPLLDLVAGTDNICHRFTCAISANGLLWYQ